MTGLVLITWDFTRLSAEYFTMIFKLHEKLSKHLALDLLKGLHCTLVAKPTLKAFAMLKDALIALYTVFSARISVSLKNGKIFITMITTTVYSPSVEVLIGEVVDALTTNKIIVNFFQLHEFKSPLYTDFQGILISTHPKQINARNDNTAIKSIHVMLIPQIRP